jgi:hypothetical protein
LKALLIGVVIFPLPKVADIALPTELRSPCFGCRQGRIVDADW